MNHICHTFKLTFALKYLPRIKLSVNVTEDYIHRRKSIFCDISNFSVVGSDSRLAKKSTSLQSIPMASFCWHIRLLQNFWANHSMTYLSWKENTDQREGYGDVAGHQDGAVQVDRPVLGHWVVLHGVTKLGRLVQLPVHHSIYSWVDFALLFCGFTGLFLMCSLANECRRRSSGSRKTLLNISG